MTRDLEETLNELGPGYREVADRLVAAFHPADEKTVAASAPRPAAVPDRQPSARRGRVIGWSVAYLVAASLVVLIGMGVLFLHPSHRASASKVYTVRATTAENEYLLAIVRDDAAVMEMIRTQNQDGSWKNDFLTKRNCEALRQCRSPKAQVAYKKALRNLRHRNLR